MLVTDLGGDVAGYVLPDALTSVGAHFPGGFVVAGWPLGVMEDADCAGWLVFVLVGG
ncbi:hypothetical protein ACIGKR_12325 [Rhodococcus qingshengii]|uniref:hypothetical protein n=1 Tax=Rhodococcus qingshengii TaxID=334542 RepID=UPI0037CA7F4C